MDFNEHKPIYLQIVDTLSERILSGGWEEGLRISSVRELGMELGVNPNTVMRAYEHLQTNEVIYNKRGIGYFVAEKAVSSIRDSQKNEFLKEDIIKVFKKMELLNISIEEIVDIYKKQQ